MTSKRNLKKQINNICEVLFTECITATLYNGEPHKDDVDAILKSIMMLNTNYIKRVSHVEPGLTAKQYFKDLIESFNNDVDEIIDQIVNLHSYTTDAK